MKNTYFVVQGGGDCTQVQTRKHCGDDRNMRCGCHRVRHLNKANVNDLLRFMQGGDLKKFLVTLNNSNQKLSHSQNLSIARKVILTNFV